MATRVEQLGQVSGLRVIPGDVAGLVEIARLAAVEEVLAIQCLLRTPRLWLKMVHAELARNPPPLFSCETVDAA
jgi:hypothetical protein